jgi:hypothetical protein
MVVAAEFFRVISPIVSIVSSLDIFWQAKNAFWQDSEGPGALPND